MKKVFNAVLSQAQRIPLKSVVEINSFSTVYFEGNNEVLIKMEKIRHSHLTKQLMYSCKAGVDTTLRSFLL